MKIEIERKYLVIKDLWSAPGQGVIYRQAYLAVTERAAVRIRIIGNEGKLSIKSKASGLSRQEFEYSIPLLDGEKLLNLCPFPALEKIRYKIKFGNHTWDVDEFKGVNEGLIIGEVELDSEDDSIQLPPWAGREVTGDKRYYNADLYEFPFKKWDQG